MKNTVLKIFVISLFIIQILGVLLYFKVFENIVSTNSFLSKMVLDHQFGNLLIVFSFIVSFFYIIIIFIRFSGKTTEVIQINQTIPFRENAESKAKVAQDQKNLQTLNQKKIQVVEELSKNLGSQTNLENLTNQVLINISKQIDIFQGIFFVKSQSDGVFRKSGAYAYFAENDSPEFSEGIGLTGQVAENKKLLNLESIPEKYITVLSGLGKSSPSNLIIFPVIFNQQSIGIIELASFIKFDTFIEQVLVEFSSHLGPLISGLNKPV